MQTNGDGVIGAYVHGIYPRSEAVVAATRDLDRGRTTPEAALREFERDLDDFVGVQRAAGLDFLSDGLLRWQDIFRPLVDSADGMHARTMVRWFDNNSFFRAPEVDAPIALGALPELFEARVRVPESRVATLPSPLLFSRAAIATGERNHLMFDLARSVLRPLAEMLVANGYSLIHFQEPWLAYNGIEKEDFKLFSESLGMVVDGLGATTVLHTYFGDAGPWASQLRDLPVDAIGIDFIETDLESLGSNWPTGIMVGCLDGRSSRMESAEDTVSFVRRVVDALAPPSLFVSSNSDLELLGRQTADAKVRVLGEAASRLRDELR
jgi:5-methyltetrahydropteroyltriglutamate--homocysteine methyltransferase